MVEDYKDYIYITKKLKNRYLLNFIKLIRIMMIFQI